MVDETTDLGKRQAHYIRREAKRHYVEEKNPAGLTVFTFEAGQRCFREHQARIAKEEIFLKRGMREVTRMRPQDWIEDFGEQQQRIAGRLK